MISKVKYMPGYGVDIFSSDGGLLRQLGVVQAEVGRDPPPHPEKTTSVDKLCIDPGYLVWFPIIVNQILIETCDQNTGRALLPTP